MIKDQILNDLKIILAKIGLDSADPLVEHSAQEIHGDYTTNIAMILWGKQNKEQRVSQNIKSPLELAEKIVECYKTDGALYFDKVEAAPPGFINFWLSKKELSKQLSEALKAGGNYGMTKSAAKKKVIVEFTDPNPFKEFHIGHLFSNIVGESISRLLEANGMLVKRANYQGDVGMHVAKSIWGMKKILKEWGEELEDQGRKPLKTRVSFLGLSYSTGAKAFEESENVKKEITALNAEIYEKKNQIKEYKLGKKWSLEYFEEIYKRLGTKFDFYYFESEVGEVGIKIVQEYLKKGVFEESEGAIIFPGKKLGLHNRVFINSLGLPTYEAKELGLAFVKYKEFAYAESIIVTGNEINDYFKVLLAALKEIAPELEVKTKHISHGMVRMPGGKISSRLGNVLLAEWLLDQAKDKAKGLIEGSSRGKIGLTRPLVLHPETAQKEGLYRGEPPSKKDFEKEIDEITEAVGIGAIKYSLLKQNIGQDINFKFEESITLEGNSGPYLQYTYARAKSVLRKLQGVNHKSQNNRKLETENWNLENEELTLLRTLYKFPEVVEKAAGNYSPNLICSYLFDLAQKFNLFYQKHPILKAEDKQRDFRLGLTRVVGQVIKNGLYLLGLSAPEKM